MSNRALVQQTNKKTNRFLGCSNKVRKLNVLEVFHEVFKTTPQWIQHRKEVLPSSAV